MAKLIKRGASANRKPAPANKTAGRATVKKEPAFLAKGPNAKKVSLSKDEDGYFVYSHRARGNSYKTQKAIPKTEIDYIESTM